MKYTLIIILVFICLNLKSQPMSSDYVEFFDYSTVINNLETNGIKSKYYQTLDIESMLYLDQSSIKTMLKISPNFLKENSIDTSDIFHRQINEFSYQFKSHSVKEYFNNRAFLLSSINKIIGEANWDLGNQIYFKNDHIAIFSIEGNHWCSLFKARLYENEVKIELLYDIIE